MDEQSYQVELQLVRMSDKEVLDEAVPGWFTLRQDAQNFMDKLVVLGMKLHTSEVEVTNG